MNGRLHAVLQRGHVGEEVEVLKDHADLAAHRAQVFFVCRHELAIVPPVSERLAVELDDAFVDTFEGHQHAQYGRLARSRRPDNRDLLVGGDVEIQRIENGELTVALRHALEANHRLHRQPRLVFSQCSSRRTPKAATRLIIRKNSPTMVTGSRY